MSFDHDGIKLQINNRKVIRKSWKLNNMLLNNPQSKKKSQGKIF